MGWWAKAANWLRDRIGKAWRRGGGAVEDGDRHPISLAAMLEHERAFVLAQLGGGRTAQDRLAAGEAALAAAIDPLGPHLSDGTWRDERDDGTSQPAAAPRLVGVALSGGGIRSATFNLGVLQVLSAQVLDHVHYLSTVSGGGFIGGCYTTLRSGGDGARAFRQTPYQTEPSAFRRLRQFSRYLAPGGGLELVRMGAIWLTGFLANLLPLVSTLALVAAAALLWRLGGQDLPPWFLAKTAAVVLVGGALLHMALPQDVGSGRGRWLTLAVVLVLMVGALAWVPDLPLRWAVAAVLAWGVAVAAMVRMAAFPLGWDGRDRRTRWLAKLLLFALFLVVLDLQQQFGERLLSAQWRVDDVKSWLTGSALGGGLVSLATWLWSKLRDEDKLALGVKLLLLVAVVVVPFGAWLLVTWLLHVVKDASPDLPVVGALLEGVGGFYIRVLVAVRQSGLGGFWGVAVSLLLLAIGGMAGRLWPRRPFAARDPGLYERWRSWYNRDLFLRWMRLTGYAGLGCFVPIWAIDAAGIVLPGPFFSLAEAGPQWWPLAWMLVFALVSLVLSGLSWLFLNINRTSLHGFYRDRISRAYLFQMVGDKAEHRDRVKLSSLGGLPYHLVNASLNVSPGQTGGGAKHLAGTVRNADFFLFSPRFVGSEVTGYRRTEVMEGCDPHLDLGTAVAISGAALAPNMGMAGKPSLSMLLAVLNLRLGYWLPNPTFCRRGWGIKTRTPQPEILFKEMLNDMSVTADFVNVTDGGHVENLGIHELLRRQCRLIIASDAEQDQDMGLAGLIKVIRMARIDLGVFVTFDDAELDAIRAGRRHWAVGVIHYGDRRKGYLLYLKLSLSGDEDPVIAAYKRQAADFPHESTGDQFFSEVQFEVYRALGHHVAKMALAGRVT